MAAGGSERLVAIDWMRGFVMVLMAIDHGSAVTNAGRLAHDSIWDLSAMGISPHEGPLGAAQFFTRWITHLCAPTFLFLSGTSLALSTTKRESRGESAGGIDRHLMIRGALLLVFEMAWMSLGPSAALGRYLAFLQVLYAIGLALILMAPLRRLSIPLLIGFALLWFVVGEAVTFAAAPPPAGGPFGLLSLLLSPVTWDHAAVLYPVTPWLAMMMLGWAFGRYLVSRRETGDGMAPGPLCAALAAASLALFSLVRGANAYGNMQLFRRDGSIVEWLHVSKYPPSLAYASLELGLMALCLAALFWLQRRVTTVNPRNPFLVLGQTALFFYLIHIHLIGVGAAIFGRIASGGLFETYVGGFGVVLVLYPACLWYRGYKAAHPRGFAQYI